jgi:hypothetical protein
MTSPCKYTVIPFFLLRPAGVSNYAIIGHRGIVFFISFLFSLPTNRVILTLLLLRLLRACWIVSYILSVRSSAHC